MSYPKAIIQVESKFRGPAKVFAYLRHTRMIGPYSKRKNNNRNIKHPTTSWGWVKEFTF